MKYVKILLLLTILTGGYQFVNHNLLIDTSEKGYSSYGLLTATYAFAEGEDDEKDNDLEQTCDDGSQCTITWCTEGSTDCTPTGPTCCPEDKIEL